MENVMFTVKMLSAYTNESIMEMAEKAGLDGYHLQQVSSGRTKMTAEDIIKLSLYTGIDPKRIQY